MTHHTTVAALCVGFALAAGVASAQRVTSTPTADADIQTTQQTANQAYLANELAGFDTAADVDIVQRGANNRADVSVVSQGATNTQVTIAQVSPDGRSVNDNVVELDLVGPGNRLSVLQQGDANVYLGDVEAADARVDVLQSGSDNVLYQQTQLDPDAGLILRQEGDGNELDASNYRGVMERTITVRQSGGARAVLQDVGPR